MQYVKVIFETTADIDSDILIAMLDGVGFTGFEETGSELYAYIDELNFDEDILKTITYQSGRTYALEVVPHQNWNALWESNFQPVIVDDFCTIRAHFHDIPVATAYEIVITPKMSFGTGHHATTQLMIKLMKDLPLKGRSVLDFGAGTGVLGILAAMLGADTVTAIDNDPWCVENAIENAGRNNCRKVNVQLGSLEDIGIGEVDVILANINRHILLHYMAALYKMLHIGGFILMSGLLVEDIDAIVQAAINEGFLKSAICEQNGWIALVFEKNNI